MRSWEKTGNMWFKMELGDPYKFKYIRYFSNCFNPPSLVHNIDLLVVTSFFFGSIEEP
jgi:hypothetical protein